MKITFLTPRFVTLSVLAIGVLLFLYALTMSRYKIEGIEERLANMDLEKSHDPYYELQNQYSTNKLLYADLGSGLVVAAVTIMLFLTTTKINSFKELKEAKSLSNRQIWSLANASLLLLIPGTFWYYGLRQIRGDYPYFSDSIAIPIMTQIPIYLILLIPMNLFILLTTYKNTLPSHLFIKDKTKPKAILWEVIFGFFLALAIICLLATIIGGDHFFVFVSMAMIYVLLCLRAGKGGLPFEDLLQFGDFWEESLNNLRAIKLKINERTILKSTKYESVEMLLSDIDEYERRIITNDESIFLDLLWEFGESGTYRMLAATNQWGKSFFVIADRQKQICDALQSPAKGYPIIS